MSMIRSAPSRILNRIIPPPLDLRYRHIAEYIYRVFARINRLNTHTQTLSIRIWRTEISTVMVGERVLSISLDVLHQDISLTPQKCRVTWRTALHQQSMWSIIFDKTYFWQRLCFIRCWCVIGVDRVTRRYQEMMIHGRVRQTRFSKAHLVDGKWIVWPLVNHQHVDVIPNHSSLSERERFFSVPFELLAKVVREF